jgi:predicted AlkP superfamily phosphohydrolase/phosphomutase
MGIAEMRDRISIIGLDGATFRIIGPLVKEGKLPNLSKMMESGVWDALESTIHPLSPQAWASFMTGKNPGKHGIFEFIQHKPNSYDLHYVNGGFVQGKKLWEILSEAGKRVCVINVPFTYPPSPVNGCLIAGLDAPGPSSEFCYPPDLMAEIVEKFGPYQLRQHPYKAKPETYLKEIIQQFEYILGVAKYLKDKEAWDLFIVVFESTDLVQHFYWHYAFPEEFGIPPTDNKDLSGAIYSVYKRIDEGLGELLALSGNDETVMVMSDHGFSPCRKIFFMDRWLQEQGYLTFEEGGRHVYAFTHLLHLAFQKYFPNAFKSRFNSLIPGMKDLFRSYLTTGTIDWEKTRAFSLGIDSTNIFINLTGRFAKGVVEPGSEYEKLRDEIAARLEGVKDPSTGERIVEKVHKREELYHGDCLSRAPDLLVTWKDFEYNTRRGYGVERDGLLGSSLEFSDVSAYSSLQKSGTHHVNGILISEGPQVNDQASVNGASIIDLAPTILYLLGVCVPEDMDGRILEEIIRPDFVCAHPIQLDSAEEIYGEKKPTNYGEREEQYIRDKLKGLGYID